MRTPNRFAFRGRAEGKKYARPNIIGAGILRKIGLKLLHVYRPPNANVYFSENQQG
jgi:hypothetical protein